jgi:hypothetical protein
MADDFRGRFDETSAAKQSSREIVVDNVLWLVYELPPTAFDRRSGPSLVFESDATMRRVRMYPANWRGLSDEDLLALSWSK